MSGSLLPLRSARPAVTFPAAERQRYLANIGSYCLVWVAHVCKPFALCSGPHSLKKGMKVKSETCLSQVQHHHHYQKPSINQPMIF